MSVENICLFNSVLDEALERQGKKNLKLKECQYEAVKAVVVDRKDTICILPTGYGKSLKCQLLPFVLLNYLFPTHAQYRRHTVFCMSITDYPRASVSFTRDRRLGERDCILFIYPSYTVNKKILYNNSFVWEKYLNEFKITPNRYWHMFA